MKRQHRSRLMFLFIILCSIVMMAGFAPLPALAEDTEAGARSLAEADPVELTNEARSLADGLSVFAHNFALKAVGTGEGGQASAEVAGDVTNATANEGQKTYALIAYGMDGGSVGTRVDGSVANVPGAAAQNPDGICGIFTMASFGSSTVEVTGNVTVEGKGDATGIRANGANASKASIKVGKDLTTASLSEGDEEYDAFCADLQAMDGSEVSLEVQGDVRAQGGSSSQASACGLLVTSASYDQSPAATCAATVRGSIGASAADMAGGAKLSAQEGSRSRLLVGGDAVGTCDNMGFGLWLESTNGGVTEVVVQGVVRGTTEGVRFDGADAANFDITAWKIESAEGGSLFQKGDYATCEAQDVAARTNYIVRIEQPQEGGTIAATNSQREPLAQSHGLEVAHAGDKVYLDVALDPGYVVAGAYNGTDERVPLSCDEDGYYLVVPEGGGVNLSVELAKDESATGMSIVDGMAQPVFAYSDVHADGYANQGSELYRFVVYVETDYDTDRDGACDLVKTFVQVPRAAVQGKYKAPVLFMADPYSAGMRGAYSSFLFAGDSVGDDALMGRPEHRTPAGSISSERLSLDPTLTKASDWNYEIDEVTYPTGVTSLDYYLVRGFAVVQAAGLGTYGSQGIECCGTVMERDAFVDVVEWLHGTQGRTAYADAAGTIEVKATDWSSGHVGMTGLSYPGGMCYEVATSGVEGLDTVVPVAGPASWYDLNNSQGICTQANTSYNYTTVLADTCASRLFCDPDQQTLDLYQRYRTYMRDSQGELAGDYGPYWAARDWYTGQTDMRASALIVHGLNDQNVSTKHSDLMRSAFLASGCEVKTLLHQNMHVTPADADERTDIMIGDHTYLEWLNLWFTRALLGVDNEAANLASFTVQSNVDGTFYRNERWDAEDVVTMHPAQEGETTVYAEGAPKSVIDIYDNPLTGEATKSAALWTLPVRERFGIAGKIAVHVRAKVDDVSPGDIMMCAALFDVADEPFGAFAVNGNVEKEVVGKGDGSSLSYDLVAWKQGQTTRKLVTSGSIDLRNPEAGYEPSTATKREEPIAANTYYDYTIWLDPTCYTVQQGHRLELYLVPFLNYAEFASSDSRDYLLQRSGLDSSAIMSIRTDYGFTIQNDASYATLPLLEEPAPAYGGKDPGDEPAEGTDAPTKPAGGMTEATTAQPAASAPGVAANVAASTTRAPVATRTPATATRTPTTADASVPNAYAVVAAALAISLLATAAPHGKID